VGWVFIGEGAGGKEGVLAFLEKCPARFRGE
jgi:hypothetical protein